MLYAFLISTAPKGTAELCTLAAIFKLTLATIEILSATALGCKPPKDLLIWSISLMSLSGSPVYLSRLFRGIEPTKSAPVLLLLSRGEPKEGLPAVISSTGKFKLSTALSNSLILSASKLANKSALEFIKIYLPITPRPVRRTASEKFVAVSALMSSPLFSKPSNTLSIAVALFVTLDHWASVIPRGRLPAMFLALNSSHCRNEVSIDLVETVMVPFRDKALTAPI